jgi:uncharacterized protein (DUF924 family)
LSAAAPPGPDEVIGFWRSAGAQKWYAKEEAFDRQIAERFGALHAQAAAGGLKHWAADAQGTLALLILLDQFSRNLFRGSPKAFAQDEAALLTARSAVTAGYDRHVEPEFRQFFYTPFMHSEGILDQERCVALCHSLPDPGNLPFARDHERIIRRFGRFPHRNAALGRLTTPADQAFLESGGFAG